MKITIIIPVYNEQAHIEHMLGSLVGQTIKPSQVIIVDDNSTDNTPS
ncbi:MAG: glycosyltransferase family 2 protein, partial [Flavobacteriales bacterium]